MLWVVRDIDSSSTVAAVARDASLSPEIPSQGIGQLFAALVVGMARNPSMKEDCWRGRVPRLSLWCWSRRGLRGLNLGVWVWSFLVDLPGAAPWRTNSVGCLWSGGRISSPTP